MVHETSSRGSVMRVSETRILELRLYSGIVGPGKRRMSLTIKASPSKTAGTAFSLAGNVHMHLPVSG